jgi:integrase
MKLTTTTVTALTPPDGKTDYIAWDDALPGFGVRIRAGRKSYVCQYRTDDRQQRRESLGDVRRLKLEDARKIARQRFAVVEMGGDPAADKAQARAADASASLTLGRTADRYLAARKDALRPNSYAAAARYFAVHWAPFHGRPIASIKRAEVAAQLQEIVANHGRVAAARARAYLSALYGWAVRDGLCAVNPAIGTNNPAAGLPSRDRVLSGDEIRSIWNACGDDDASRIIRLLLLTASRRDEIGRLQWQEVDFERGQIVISASRSKNRKAHVVPLPATALNILRAVPRRQDAACVFGEPDSGFSGWSNATRKLRAQMAKPFVFVLHDLRRTAATGMADLGVQPHIIEAVLNHSSGTKAGVAGIYNRALYEREKAAALTAWSDFVTATIKGTPRKVVPLRTA